MADPVEVAIEAALLAHLQQFAEAQSLSIAQPNISFTPPAPVTKTSRYLRATFLPVPTTRMISGPDTHSGLFQVDVFWGAGAGELKPARVASAIIQHFRDQDLPRDGIVVEVRRQVPHRFPMVFDGAWAFIPVRIPYDCYAN